MSILDLDALLGQSMAEVEAAPNYVDLETGVYILEVVEAKADKQKTKDPAKARAEGKAEEYVVLKHQYKVISVELTEGNVQPVAVGSLASDQWQLTDKGLPFFKTRTADIAVAGGEAREIVDTLSVGECLLAVKGAQFRCQAKKIPRQKDGVVVEGQFNVRLENICAVPQ